MASFDELIPEHIRQLKRYVPGKPVRTAQSESGALPMIKMASNENPFGPSPAAMEAIRRAAAEANFYPDNDNRALRQRLAQRYQLEPQQVLVTAGTTEFIGIIARTLLGPGLNAVSSERTFIVYPIAVQAAGGRMIEVPMREDTFDLDGILAAIDAQTRIVFLANPNNPTGTMFEAAAFERFLARVPEHVLVVLDEAYCDFAEYFAKPAGIVYSRSLDYVRQGRRLIVLRTFSKAHGLAGLRIGYGMAAAGLLEHFARVRTAFSVSGVAEAAALAAMDDSAHVQRALENNAAGLAWLTPRLRQLGLRVLPTFGNFLYIEAGQDAGALARRMQAAGVIVRPLTAWGAPTAIRVTIGTPEQNQAFLAALHQALERATVP